MLRKSETFLFELHFNKALWAKVDDFVQVRIYAHDIDK